MTHATTEGFRAVTSGWVDEILLAGDPTGICFRLPEPIDRGTLRDLVGERQARLTAAGLRAGGGAALRLAPSLAYVANLLAIWRLGGQAVLLDHRLTDVEVDLALDRLDPQVVVSAAHSAPGSALRVFHEVTETVWARGDRPAATGHTVVQLSSGSTGPSKVIGRTAADLVAEVERYTLLDGVPLRGERIVLLPSMVHVLGLVGGLLYGLHAGVELVPPQRLSGEAILDAVAAQDTPATVLGVPFHLGLLASTAYPHRLPQFRRMTTGGEPVPAATARAFEERFGARLANMYGMTEVGVIGTDLHGTHRPAIEPVPGIAVRAVDGELWVSCPASPYLGVTDPTRWADGWLRTRDAGTVADGLVTVRGRLDSQVSIGGAKVDLTEVEAAVAAVPGVAAAVVVHDRGIVAYVQPTQPTQPTRPTRPARPTGPLTADVLDDALARRLASYKRPQVIHLLDQLPRTTTGKLVRDPSVLRAAARS